MKQPTLQQFKVWAKSHRKLAHAVVMAQAFAQCKREQVDAYIKPVFELFDFYVADEWVERGRPREKITEIRNLYLTDLQGPDYLRFLEECDKEHREHGFKGPKGHCPALEAEHLQIIAENALIAAAGPLFDVDFAAHCHLERRRQLLDLLLGACLKREAA